MLKSLEFMRKEKLFLFLLALLVIWSIHKPTSIIQYYKFVNWNTIIALTGLLIISNGIRESNILDKITNGILRYIKSERFLALFFMIFSAGLSMFLTNDIALFIIIPLTLSLQNFLKNDIKKLIIFEAIAVNVGSSLTPIGNPQNLFLWHLWNISFVDFVLKMFPLVSLLILPLVLFSIFVFKNQQLDILKKEEGKIRGGLAYISLPLLGIYIVSLELRLAKIFFIPIFLLYLFLYREVLKRIDWFLLFIFILMFIDVHLVSQLNPVVKLVSSLNLTDTGSLFFLSLLFSQIISNVPAAIFISKFSHSYLPITYGVNVGGNGFIIGSLANIIALRIANNKRLYVDFHKYSFPYLAISAFIGYWLLIKH